MATTNLPEITNHMKDGQASGQRLIPADTCYYPPAVKSADLLLVDFDAREIGAGGGLYLVEEIRGGSVTWMGCRRFDHHPGQTLLDIDGEGSWQPINLQAIGWRIAGAVRQVFKPSM